MDFLNKMNKRVENMSVFDLKLTQWATLFITLIIAKIFPRILNINIWWFVGLCILCLIKPIYVFCLKKP
jgi:magnesium-transporting ATPase (P-type)